MKFKVFQLFLKMNVLKKHVQDKNIVELEKLKISPEFSEELFYYVLGRCSKVKCYDEDIQMLNLFLKNITSSINVENYLCERYQNFYFKDDYLHNYLINKNIISRKRNVYTVNYEFFNIYSKFKQIKLCYQTENIGTLIISDYVLIYDFNDKIHKYSIFGIFGFLREEFLRFMFNKKIVIFTLINHKKSMNDIFNHFGLKGKYEKSLRKLLNFERRKNALMWCESIKNLNNALGWVFNNLHLKIEIIKFL